MLTQDDLSSIQKLVKKEVQGVEERIGTKIDGFGEALNGVAEALEAKIAKVQETADIIQEVMVKHHTALEQRVTNLEEKLHSSGN
ncbi:MAG: hypothetical protein HY429_03595 [Candidatus Levybacteria bacterium]|nr:hypothetical protein [Candidatus Levybacteria bacterium]